MLTGVSSKVNAIRIDPACLMPSAISGLLNRAGFVGGSKP